MPLINRETGQTDEGWIGWNNVQSRRLQQDEDHAHQQAVQRSREPNQGDSRPERLSSSS